jgi:3-hydroxymyristoyl/3-hydroxydecanoyl-(acyl carrier protein) dehydratases
MSEVHASHRLAIGADHPAFDGHFPGRPILPGVALLAAVLEAAAREPRLAACIGTAPRLAVVKFLAPVGPGAALSISFRLGASALDWQIDDDSARAIASGRIARADRGGVGSA